jgi:imidazolonepropionase-like amidohydrolase
MAGLFQGNGDITMKLGLVAGILSLSSTALWAQDTNSAKRPAVRTVLHCSQAIDVVAGKSMGSTTIVVEADKILEVVAGVQSRPGANTVELTGTCLPGLTDLHTHLSSGVRGTRRVGEGNLTDTVLLAAYNARKTLLAGFTTVRNMGDGDYETVALRDAINANLIEGPRIYTAGVAISSTGGHADPTNSLPIAQQGDLGPAESIINSPEEAFKAVRMHYKEHADCIKYMSSGGVLDVGSSVGNPQMTQAEANAIVEAAHDYGFTVGTHAIGAEGIRRAILAGVDSIEHGTFMDEDDVKLMKEHKTWYVPTVYANHYVAELAKKPNGGGLDPASIPKALMVGPHIMQQVRNAWHGGVRFAYGTDAGVFPNGENWRDFPLLVEAGIPPMYALQMATINAAQVLKHTEEWGSITPGKYADVIAVDGDPLQDMKVMSKVGFVMKSGVIYKNQGSAAPFRAMGLD